LGSARITEAVEWLDGQWAGDSLKRFEAMTPGEVRPRTDARMSFGFRPDR
jgi:hypothetical protein